MKSPTVQKFWTYNELAALFGVSCVTIWRRFRNARKLRLTDRTVRIPQSELDKVIKQGLKKR